MFAQQNQHIKVIDALSGSMEEWYETVDDAFKKCGVIYGNYKCLVATSYGNVGKITEDSLAYFDITCDGYKVISFDNSFISVEQYIMITAPTQANYIYSTYYISYKHAADCID